LVKNYSWSRLNISEAKVCSGNRVLIFFPNIVRLALYPTFQCPTVFLHFIVIVVTARYWCNINLSRGIFVTERTGTPFRKLFSEGRKPERRSGTFFPCHWYNEVRRVLLSNRSSF
jgi:hypothetical protein